MVEMDWLRRVSYRVNKFRRKLGRRKGIKKERRFKD